MHADLVNLIKFNLLRVCSSPDQRQEVQRSSLCDLPLLSGSINDIICSQVPIDDEDEIERCHR